MDLLSTSPEEAPLRPETATADLGFAKLDLDRARRCGFPEVIFGEGKTPDHLVELARKLQEAGQVCLVTRVSNEQASILAAQFPHATQDRVARTFWLPGETQQKSSGKVIVLTAGTADLPVAQEALVTAKAFGCDAQLVSDVGVAGLHRLLAQVEALRSADVLIVVAGMEGALPSVVGGLVSVPVIAVPTSVGYGANFQGLSALLCMLNSCAANVAVVNIDAGFKAGYLAGLMVSNQTTGK